MYVIRISYMHVLQVSACLKMQPSCGCWCPLICRCSYNENSRFIVALYAVCRIQCIVRWMALARQNSLCFRYDVRLQHKACLFIYCHSLYRYVTVLMCFYDYNKYICSSFQTIFIQRILSLRDTRTIRSHQTTLLHVLVRAEETFECHNMLGINLILRYCIETLIEYI